MTTAIESSKSAGAQEPFTFEHRLAQLKRIKSEQSVIKRSHGPRDTDDWGDVPYEKQFVFIPQTDHPKGYVLGARDCGRNFRLFLESCPTYVCRYRSLLGGYYVTFMPYATKWDPENFWNHLAADQRRYNVVHGIDNSHHFGIDLQIGLDLGFGGLLEKVRRFRDENPNADLGFYEGLEQTVLGIQGWIRNHIEAARLMAAIEEHPQVRRNLEQLIEVNERIVDNKPATFHEAVQWTAWFQMAARMYNGSGAIGRIDQYFYPFYKKDIAAGQLTDEEAIFHLQCLNLADPQYYHIGGIDEDGNDASNELSFLVLEAVHRLKIPTNVSIGVHDRMNKDLMRKAVELLFLDKLGTPRFFGVDQIAEGYAKNGVPLKIARQRQQVGCHWTNLPGTEYSFSDVIKVNFAKVLNQALYEMMGDPGVQPSIDELWRRFEKHLRHAVDVTARGIDFHMEYKHQYYPELVLDLLSHGPVEKGVDASHGSLEYNTICVDGSALATAADSFAALEVRVEKEKRLSWNEVIKEMDNDFRGPSQVANWLKNVPSYGRGGTVGDKWAERISQLFTQLVKEKPTPDGWMMVPGLFSWASTLPMGKQTEATPNGRKRTLPISFGANPDPGLMKGGSVNPTAMSNSIARVQPGYGNAAPMQLDVDPGLVYDEDGVEKFAALIRGHFKMGGTLINANILDKEVILDAYKNPTKYPDLVVRVTGFSAYFASLSEDFRKLVYNRIVSMEGGDD